jgi:hypothetical protein
MKIMLTSFGIDRPENRGRSASMFARMPPVSFRSINESFLPDYELLVLFEKIVMDENSFHALIQDSAYAYAGVAEAFRALHAEGLIELVDFEKALHRNDDLLQKMLEHDLRLLDQWVSPLRESIQIWRQFLDTTWRILRAETHHSQHHLLHHSSSLPMHTLYMLHNHASHGYAMNELVNEALSSSEKRKHKEYRDALRETVRAYLGYVNANLVLSNEFDVPFHDWQDLMPFYNLKFLSVGKRSTKIEHERKEVERLFTVAFPELAIRDTKSLLKVLKDKRVEELRKLIADAALGKAQFDEVFARRVLMEVLQTERKVTRFRNVLGYLTLPLGFIPTIGTPVQKVVEEIVTAPVAKAMKEKHRWFYLLSEAAEAREID